ncbi:MAG: NAD-dependent epimerase/dehydratase family protein [Pseudomonadota bacterium]
MAVAKHRPSVLVTGATGAIGPLVVEAFRAAGYSVRTLSIDSPPISAWPDDVEVLIGDVTDASAVHIAMQGVELVIHLAALLHVVNPPEALLEKYKRVNVGGTSTVVAAAIQAGVRRIVFFSTIAVYGQSNGRILTEDTPPYPDTFYARTKLEAEKIVLEAKDEDGRRIGTVLRLGAVYGCSMKGNYRRLVQSLARGRFMPVGNGSNRRTLVYDKDVARAAVLAAIHPNATGRIFNVTDGQFHTMKAVIETLCDALGRKSPRLTLPAGPVRCLVGFLEDCARGCGLHSPIVRATVDKYTEDVAVDGGRFFTQIGFVPQYNLAAGWWEIVAEMRQSGDI